MTAFGLLAVCSLVCTGCIHALLTSFSTHLISSAQVISTLVESILPEIQARWKQRQCVEGIIHCCKWTFGSHALSKLESARKCTCVMRWFAALLCFFTHAQQQKRNKWTRQKTKKTSSGLCKLPAHTCTIHFMAFSSSDSSCQNKVKEITLEEITRLRRTDNGAARFSNSRVLQSIDEFSSDVPSLPPDTHQPVENEHLRWL